MNASRYVGWALIASMTACSSGSSPGDSTGVTDTDGNNDDGDDDDGNNDGDTVGDGADDGGDTGLSFPACAASPLPTSCGIDATTTLSAGAFGDDGAEEVTIETLANPRDSAPADVSVYRPSGKANVPVVFFAHAYGATKVTNYDVLLRNLASNGIAVVFVPYENFGLNADRYEDLWSGFTAAVATYGDTFDLTHVGFVGHSFGGGATPEMARRGFVEQGWGSAGRFMFIFAPWYSWGSDYDTIPTDVRTVIEVYADDDKNDHQIAVHDVWEKLPADIERGWLLVRSDVCDCGLNADHVVPMSAAQQDSDTDQRYNAYDRWGVARRVEGLAAYAFSGDMTARGVAYGDDTQMGNWLGCGGRAIRPLEAASSPLTTTCVTPLYPYSARCDNADPGAAGCP